MAERKLEELGALWVRESKAGKSYMTGKVCGQDVVVFANTGGNGKAPNWKIYKSQPRDGQSPSTRVDDTDDINW